MYSRLVKKWSGPPGLALKRNNCGFATTISNTIIGLSLGDELQALIWCSPTVLVAKNCLVNEVIKMQKKWIIQRHCQKVCRKSIHQSNILTVKCLWSNTVLSCKIILKKYRIFRRYRTFYVGYFVPWSSKSTPSSAGWDSAWFTSNSLLKQPLRTLLIFLS